jgi:hypothetical protein
VGKGQGPCPRGPGDWWATPFCPPYSWLERYDFGGDKIEPRSWLNLQAEYDTRVVTREFKDKIAPRIRVFHPVAD